MKNPDHLASHREPFDLDLDDLLHPAQAFDHPKEVLADPDLTVNEKRAILASWASDACAVEAAPALRCVPGGGRTVTVDEILEALRTLDREAQARMAQTSQVRRRVRGPSGLLRSRRSPRDGGPDHDLSP